MGVSAQSQRYVNMATALIEQGALLEVEEEQGHHRWAILLESQNVVIVLEAHDDDPFMNLEELYSFERKKGYASKAMKKVIDAADEWGVDMELDVEPFSYRVADSDDEMMGSEKLESFYERFGFNKTEMDGMDYYHRIVS